MGQTFRIIGNMSTSTNLSKLLYFVNNKISQNTQFAIPPVKMNELLQDLLHLDRVINF
jgi:hypothetical protein